MVKILIVDDYEDNRELYSQLLEASGHATIVSHSPEHAFGMLAENPQFILSDQSFQHCTITGLEFLAKAYDLDNSLGGVLITGRALGRLCRDFKSSGQ